MKALLIWTASILMAYVSAEAQLVKDASHSRVILVELFTSEGCSSCPPADALLRQIDGTRTSADQLIVGVSEHVTYWNQLGWSDRFSSAVYTARQNAYGSSFDLDSVYTPQMVVNGTEQFVGSDRQKLTEALQKEEGQAFPVVVQILSTSLNGNSLSVSFSVSGQTKQGATVFAVLADDIDKSSVLRGENSGRTLVHVAVARMLTRVGKLEVGAQQITRITVPPSMHEVLGHHVILFAQADRTMRILSADSKAL